MLAKAGPNGYPIATPSTCSKYLLLNVKNVYQITKIMLGDVRVILAAIVQVANDIIFISY